MGRKEFLTMLDGLFDQVDRRFSEVRTLTYTEDSSVQSLIAMGLRSFTIDLKSILDLSWNFVHRHFDGTDDKPASGKCMTFPNMFKKDLEKEFDDLFKGHMVTLRGNAELRDHVKSAIAIDPELHSEKQEMMKFLYEIRNSSTHDTFPDIELKEKEYTAAFGLIKEQKVFYVRHDSKEVVVLEFMTAAKRIVAQTVTSLLYSCLIIPSACELLFSYVYGLKLQDTKHSLVVELDTVRIEEAYTFHNKENAALTILQKLTATIKTFCMPNPYTHLAFDTCKPQMKPVRLENLGTHQCALYEYVEKMKELGKKVEIKWEENMPECESKATKVTMTIENNLEITCTVSRYNVDGRMTTRNEKASELINALEHLNLIVFRPPPITIDSITEQGSSFVNKFNGDVHAWFCQTCETEEDRCKITISARQGQPHVYAQTILYHAEKLHYSEEEIINNNQQHSMDQCLYNKEIIKGKLRTQLQKLKVTNMEKVLDDYIRKLNEQHCLPFPDKLKRFSEEIFTMKESCNQLCSMEASLIKNFFDKVFELGMKLIVCNEREEIEITIFLIMKEATAKCDPDNEQLIKMLASVSDENDVKEIAKNFITEKKGDCDLMYFVQELQVALQVYNKICKGGKIEEKELKDIRKWLSLEPTVVISKIEYEVKKDEEFSAGSKMLCLLQYHGFVIA